MTSALFYEDWGAWRDSLGWQTKTVKFHLKTSEVNPVDWRKKNDRLCLTIFLAESQDSMLTTREH